MLAGREHWVDFYGILQVHDRADADIISSAYRRLCKRYHPDINKGPDAAKMMQKINAAYETLSDARRRAAYDAECARRGRCWPRAGKGADAGANAGTGAGAGADADAAFALKSYFKHIKDKNYRAAYGCVSEHDKKRISEADFARWQSAVGGAVELRDVGVRLFRRCPGGAVGAKRFDDAYEYTVRICERERPDGRIREYLCPKRVVRDGGKWGVYLGYRSVRRFIGRFARAGGAPAPGRAGGAARLSDAEAERLAAAARERIERHGSTRDELTGLPNLRGLAAAAKHEASRSGRSGGAFSIAAFEARGARGDESSLAMMLGGILADALRDADVPGRLDGARFAAVMPDTGLAPAKAAANRICASFRRLMQDRAEKAGQGAEGGKYEIFAGVCEYDGSSFKPMLAKCIKRLSAAKRARCLRAVAGKCAALRKGRYSKKFSCSAS